MNNWEKLLNKQKLNEAVHYGFKLTNQTLMDVAFLNSREQNLRGHVRNAAIDYALSKFGFELRDKLNSAGNYIYSELIISDELILTVNHIGESCKTIRSAKFRESLTLLNHPNLPFAEFEGSKSMYGQILYTGHLVPSSLFISFPGSKIDNVDLFLKDFEDVDVEANEIEKDMKFLVRHKIADKVQSS